MMLPHVETDGRFVSGQNPYSTAATTEAIVRALGQSPAPREPWADERSMELLARLIAGKAPEAAAELRQNPSAYDMPLIAIWGYHQSLAAGDDPTRLQQGLAAMDLALPHVDEPQLKAAADPDWTFVGLAPTSSAAGKLGADADIESRTVAALLAGGGHDVTDRHVLVLDEAGQLGSRQALRVLQISRDTGARVIFMDDGT